MLHIHTEGKKKKLSIIQARYEPDWKKNHKIIISNSSFRPQTSDIRVSCTNAHRPIWNPSLGTIPIHFRVVETTPPTSTDIINSMLHLLWSPRYLPAAVLVALTERVGWTYPALISKADEPITRVAFVIWAACIAVRVIVIDFQSHTIFVAFRASRELKSGDRHCCSRDRLGLL